MYEMEKDFKKSKNNFYSIKFFAEVKFFGYNTVAFAPATSTLLTCGGYIVS